MGVCRPVLQILTISQTKKCHFPHLFSDLKNSCPFSDLEVVTKHNITCLPQNKNYVISLSENPFRIRVLHFLSYSVGIETTITLIRNRVSFINHTRFHTKMSKVFTRFQTKTAQRPYSIPPPPPPRKILALLLSTTFCILLHVD